MSTFDSMFTASFTPRTPARTRIAPVAAPVAADTDDGTDDDDDGMFGIDLGSLDDDATFGESDREILAAIVSAAG